MLEDDTATRLQCHGWSTPGQPTTITPDCQRRCAALNETMFQDFHSPSGTAQTADRVKRLRALMSERSLDAFLVPRADEHQGEYVPACAERLKWISGFTGSAGLAAIARRSACLFVDGRYTLQAPAQIDMGLFTIRQAPEQKLSDWLIEQLPSGAVVGFDPWLHTMAEIEQMTQPFRDQIEKLEKEIEVLAIGLAEKVKESS